MWEEGLQEKPTARLGETERAGEEQRHGRQTLSLGKQLPSVEAGNGGQEKSLDQSKKSARVSRRVSVLKRKGRARPLLIRLAPGWLGADRWTCATTI